MTGPNCSSQCTDQDQLTVEDTIFRDSVFYPSRGLSLNELIKASSSNDIHNRPSFRATLTVKTGQTIGTRGAFKTAHVAVISDIEGDQELAAPFAQGHHCAKQFYKEKGKNKAVGRKDVSSEARDCLAEMMGHEWADSLFAQVNAFVDKKVSELGYPEFPIPRMRYVSAAVVRTFSPKEKVFLVEELIGEDDGQFIKYIHNSEARPTMNAETDEEKYIAEFLCFVQHVQYTLSGKQVFTSDIQGEQCSLISLGRN